MARRYTDDEKAEAVRLVRQLRADLGTDRGTAKQVAEQLGYSVSSVTAWVRQADSDAAAMPSSPMAEDAGTPGALAPPPPAPESHPPGWWLASDGKWYPPQPAAPAPAPPLSADAPGLFGSDPKATAKAAKAYAKAQRPWYKKKRFILPLVLVGVIVIANVAGSGGDDGDGKDAASSTDTTMPDEDEPTQGEDSEGTTTTAEPEEADPTVTAGFTLYDGVPGETWASVGIVVVGGSDNQGSLELTVTLSDAAGSPIATESTFVGVSPEGQEVYASVSFYDDVAAATEVRVDVSDASSFSDGELVPVTVGDFAFDGTFFEISGTATNDTTEPIEFGSVDCVAFRGDTPVAGFLGSLDTIAPGATIAWNSSDTFDPAAEDVRCTGDGGF